ncbi:MAG TPA: hypothetical protein VGR56_03440 [Nitrososphaerales archaeon]|nr:hypothetical protein [Nitrososphaerales archaeon]
MKAFKLVRFGYFPTAETKQLLETFRMMVNRAIHISFAEGIRGRLRLRDRIYKEFQEKYEVVSFYPYCVAEVAWSILRKHKNRGRKPVANSLMMKMDSANYSMNHAILTLPFKKGKRLLVLLELGDYQRSFLLDETLKRGSVTVTERFIFISFSKEIKALTPLRRVGIDLNEKSVVLSEGNDVRPFRSGSSAHGVRN